jgi:hypothetical protein
MNYPVNWQFAVPSTVRAGTTVSAWTGDSCRIRLISATDTLVVRSGGRGARCKGFNHRALEAGLR